MVNYKPQPIDTSQIQLSGDILDQIELLAKNAHDVWAQQRFAEGWTWGPERNDPQKKSPNLIPYEKLPESEKEYDRQMTILTIKAMAALGYKIEKKRG